MKKIFDTLLLSIFSAVVLFSCATTEEVPQDFSEDKPIVEEIQPEPVTEEPIVELEPEIETEEIIDEDQLKEDSEVTLSFGGEEEILLEPEVETLTEDDLEYTRSIAGTTDEITFDEFKSDKEAILAIISELERNQKTGNINDWLKHLSQESKTYWSNSKNLEMISKMIPDNTTTLRSIDEYFKKVYLAAREGRKVTEIRYNSQTDVKAVEVQGNSDIIIYDFIKQNGKWFLALPKLK